MHQDDAQPELAPQEASPQLLAEAACPGSARIMAMDVCVDVNLLVLGDQLGRVFVFRVPEVRKYCALVVHWQCANIAAGYDLYDL